MTSKTAFCVLVTWFFLAKVSTVSCQNNSTVSINNTSVSPTVTINMTASESATTTITVSPSVTVSESSTASMNAAESSTTLAASITPSTSNAPAASASSTATPIASSTPSPTATPAASSTPSPTVAPTASSTPSPTVAPTASSTPSPTVAPAASSTPSSATPTTSSTPSAASTVATTPAKANAQNSTTVSVAPSSSASAAATASSSAAASSVAPASASAAATATASTPVVATTTAAGGASSGTVQIQPTSTQATPAATSVATPTAKATAQPVATTTKPPVPAVVEIVTAARITGEDYVAAYSDQSSPEYKNKSKEIKEKLEKAFDGANVTINSIVEGSIIVNYTLTLIVKAGYDPVKNLTAMIQSGKLGGFTVDKTYIKIEKNFKGVILTDYEIDSSSYQEKCCNSNIGIFKMTRKCTKASGSCFGIEIEKEEDCGKATNPPTCSKACSLANMSLVTMVMGFIASKIFV